MSRLQSRTVRPGLRSSIRIQHTLLWEFHMGIASFSPTNLMDSVHGLLGWITSGSGKHHHGHTPPALRSSPARGMVLRNGYAESTAAHSTFAPSPRPPSRPLRVLRVMEAPPLNNTSAGRIRISGRMADVCAELDRLAALEAAPHNSTLLQ
jgi:hypothetical protein